MIDFPAELSPSRYPKGGLILLQILMLLAGGWAGLGQSDPRPRADQIPQRFRQEWAAHRMGDGAPTGRVDLVEIGREGSPRVFHDGRWTEWRGGRWTAIPGLAAPSEDTFVFPGEDGKAVLVKLPWREVRQLVRTRGVIHLATATEPFAVRNGVLAALGWSGRGRVHQVAMSPQGRLYVASGGGLFRESGQGWESVRVTDGAGRQWAVEDVLGVTFDAAGRLWFASRAGVGCLGPEGWKFYEGKDGLPWNDFTGMAAGPDGSVWFGTRLGAIRFDADGWHYRQGPRWLPHDDVRAVAVDGEGTAWMATAAGVGRIERRPMTLAEKAAHYEREIERHVKRTRFGFVAEAQLRRPGERESADPQDSDNDGLWTAMYGAGECFAWAATKDPVALTRARQAFEALRFLQKVTEGGTPAPPAGYIARTIRPVEWPDPNVGRLERDREEQKSDALWKAYEPRWPKSADGQWYWKSDTSSDELDGHYFFYPLYHDLCAADEAEKERVREVVRGVTDHLLAHQYALTDHDGRPTRWAVYGPQSLNRDPMWWPERGLNSLSILSYLTVAEHLTGDPKYARAARELIDRHGYAHNAMFPKVQHGPGSGNQSDDEMAFMCFYNLLRYSKDEELKGMIRYSFFRYWANESSELNPFFHLAYAAVNGSAQARNPWGTFPIRPWEGWLEDSRLTLEGFPLDRLNWPHRNSHRLDILPLTPVKSQDLYAPRRGRERGYRVNGKVLPVENRHFTHWNTDPWALDYGGNGGELAAGTVYLLPYYLGLYHGFIEKPVP